MKDTYENAEDIEKELAEALEGLSDEDRLGDSRHDLFKEVRDWANKVGRF